MKEESAKNGKLYVRIRGIFLLLYFTVFLSFSQASFAIASQTNDETSSYKAGTVLLKLKTSVEDEKQRLDQKLVRILKEHDSKETIRPVFNLKKRGPRQGGSSVQELRNSSLRKWGKMNVNPKTDIQKLCDRLMKTGKLEACQPDYFVKLHSLPNDAYIDPDQDGIWSQGAWGQSFEDLWGLKKIQAVEAWNAPGCDNSCQGKGVVVAVVDTGLDYNHPDIQGNIYINTAEDINGNGQFEPFSVSEGGDLDGIDQDSNGYTDDASGYDFSTCEEYNFLGECVETKPQDPDPMDGHGHGTHVSGTIAAVSHNGIGIAGVAPKAKILPLKGLNDAGSGEDSELADAIRYAVDLLDEDQDGVMDHPLVVSNSWGCYGGCPSNPVVEDAVSYAHQMNATIVFAAGNDTMDVLGYSPQNMEETITVAATNTEDDRATFSNYGAGIDVAAPGEAILSLRAADTDMFLGTQDYIPGSRFVPRFDPNPLYYRSRGTSMAAPHVSGLAALLASSFHELSNEDIRARIKGTVEPFDVSQVLPIGTGTVNAYRALTETPKPFIRFAGLQFEEHVGDGDQIPEAGEEIRLVIELENVWGPADRVTASVSSASDSPVMISSPECDYGAFDTNEKKDNSASPFVFQIGQIEAARETLAEFELVTDADGVEQSYAFSVPLGVRKIFNAPGLYGYDSRVQNTRFHGHRIAWILDRTFIYVYDLAAEALTLIHESNTEKSHLLLSGDYLAWSESGSYDIFLHDFESETTMPVVTGPEFELKLSQAIDENQLVYLDTSLFDPDTVDIMLLDLDTSQDEVVVSLTGGVSSALISNALLAWNDKRFFSVDNRNRAVFLMDLNTGVETQITDGTTDANATDVEGNDLILELVNTGEKRHIYLHDVSQGTQTQLSTGVSPGIPYLLGDYRGGDISGDYVVWINTIVPWDYRQIEYYNLKTGVTHRITTSPGIRGPVHISGNLVIWREWNGLGSKIWLTELPLANQPPQFDPIPDQIVQIGETLRFTVSAIDPDGKKLTYSALNLPRGASFDPLKRSFFWTPTADQAGVHSACFEVSDGTDEATITVFITVTAPGDFDQDGDVDGNDFLTWQRGFGTGAGVDPADGDTDGDGDVDADDLSKWKMEMGG